MKFLPLEYVSHPGRLVWKPEREIPSTSQSQLTAKMLRCLAVKANLIPVEDIVTPVSTSAEATAQQGVTGAPSEPAGGAIR